MRLAVLTGDGVRSSRWTQEQTKTFFAIVESCALRMALWQDAPVAYARFRGDGWQLVLQDPVLGVRAALLVHASLLAEGSGLSTRVAVAVGPAPEGWDASVDPGRFADPVFRESGRALETMPRHRRMVHERGRGLYGAVVALLDADSARWTPAQARAVREALPPGSLPQAAIAARLGVSQPTVSATLRAAGWPAMRDALRALEAAPL